VEESVDPPGVALRCWGWSKANLEEARGRAREAFVRLADRVRSGHPFPDRYAYGSRAMREEIVREIPGGASAEAAGIITRNSYGCLVLNTAQVMFIDVDAPQAAQKSGGWFRKKAAPVEDAAPLNDLRNRLQRLSGSFRIYKTAAGFRVLATDRCYDPASAESEDVMRAVQADLKFIQLCRAQKSFRARLTPKPWRCGRRAPGACFPRETSREQDRFNRWLSDYESSASGFATCARLDDVRSGSMDDEVSRIVSWHDEYTKSASGLPLA
jgi:hypothetical protein